MPLEFQVVLAGHLASGFLTALLAALLWWFGNDRRHRQYRIWAGAWFAFAIYSVTGALAFTLGVLWPQVLTPRLPISVVSQASHTAGSAMLVWGTLAFLRDWGVRRRDLAWVLGCSLALGGIVALASALGAPGWVRPLYRSVMAGSALAASAVLLLRGASQPAGPTRLLAGVMVALGLVHLHYATYWLARAGGVSFDYSLTLWSLLELPLVAGIVATMAAMALSDQRVRTAEALREKDRRHRDILDHLASGVLIAKEGRVAYANPALAKMFGYDPDALLGMETTTVVHPDDRPVILDARRRALSGEVDTLTFGFRGVRRDGSHAHIHLTATVMEHEGAPAIVGHLLDITDRVQAEERDRLLSTMLDAAPSAIIVTAVTGELLFANSTAAELQGLPMQELLALRVTELVPPDDRPRLADAVDQVRNQGAYAFDTRIVRADGSLFPTQVSAKAVDWYGQPSVLCVVTDLTSHLRGEAERERLSTALDHAGEAIVITDATGLIQYVNPAFETVSGFSRAEALGQNPRILGSGKQGSDFYRQLWETIASGRTWHGQLVNRHRDGHEYTEEATISPVKDQDGAIVAYVAVKRDITEELRTRSELNQAQRLESVGRLAGGVAHDFNNLLVLILGYTDFAIQSLAQGDPVREDLEQVRGAAERATGLTRQLLAFSRRQLLVREVFDLNRVLAELERMLQRIVGEDVDLSVHLPEGPCMILGDPGRMEQVVMNLVVNAKDAMPQGGRLIIETRCLDPEDAPPLTGLTAPVPRVVELSVSDSGHGMDQATLEMVFEPFFTTKELGKGTGLGLSTAYGVIKQTGGEIRVESEVDVGTTFRIYLPMTEEAPTALPRADEAHGSDATETILIVEDDDQVRRLAERTLRQAGYRVLSAASGGDAIVLREKEAGPIHLLLTDVVMPHMSGPELSVRLRETDPALRVIFMSGYTDDRLRDYGPSGLAASILAKPFSPDGLKAQVRSTLAG